MNTQQILDDLMSMLVQIKDRIIQSAPHLIGAVIYLLLGYFIAQLMRKAVHRGLLNIDRIVPRPAIRSHIKRFIKEKRIAVIFSEMIYWTLIIFVLAISTDTLGLPVVSEWLNDLAGYLPKIFAAVVIVAIGIIISLIVRDVVFTAATSAGIAQGNLISRLLQVAIILIASLLGVGHLGLDVSLITTLITLTIGAICLRGALAFGLGAGTSVGNILAAHYLKRIFSVGQMITINGQTGRIIRMTPTVVILESTDGRVVIPARLFNDQAAIVLSEEINHEL